MITIDKIKINKNWCRRCGLIWHASNYTKRTWIYTEIRGQFYFFIFQSQNNTFFFSNNIKTQNLHKLYTYINKNICFHLYIIMFRLLPHHTQDSSSKSTEPKRILFFFINITFLVIVFIIHHYMYKRPSVRTQIKYEWKIK